MPKKCSLKKACRYGKTKFRVMEKEIYTKFIDMRIEDRRVKRRWCNSKTRELVNEKYPDEASPFKLSHKWVEGFVHVMEYPSEEKLTQFKSHQQLYVPLLRTSMQSLYKSATEEPLYLRIWVTWTKRRCLLS